MKFLLDHNLPPELARALHSLSEHKSHQVTALRDRFPVDATDETWLGELAREKNWAVVTGDTRIRRNKAEQRAWLEAKVTIFFLQKGWSSLVYWDKAAKLVGWWRIIMKTTEHMAAGAGFLVPVKGKKLEQVQ